MKDYVRDGIARISVLSHRFGSISRFLITQMGFLDAKDCKAFMAPILLLLGFFLSGLELTGAQSVGVCYGRNGNNLPSAADVINLYKSNGIGRMRIYEPNQPTLNALRGSNIELIIGILNNNLQALTNAAAATNWVQNNVRNYSPDVKFRYIAVGNEVHPSDAEAQFVLPAMQNIRNAIAAANLQNQIKVSTSIDTTLVENSFPPSKGSFIGSATSFINPIINFLVSNGAPLLVNVYPYFAYTLNPQSISLPYALFTSPGVVVTDPEGNRGYQLSMSPPSARASLARIAVIGRPRVPATAAAARATATADRQSLLVLNSPRDTVHAQSISTLRAPLTLGSGSSTSTPPSKSSPRLSFAFHTSTARYAPLLRPTDPLFAANPQSQKPASDNWKHTAQNIKEEASGIKSSLESAVAGGDSSEKRGTNGKDEAEGGSGLKEIVGDAKSVTGLMAQAVPQPALLWGAAGVMPYVATAGASIYLSRQASLVANGLDSRIDLETASALLLHAQNIQVAYGAIILSFLGAIHWGFEWAKMGGRVGNLRYAMGVAPLALAWPTLLLSPQLALITQWGAYVAVWFIDLRATTNGWAPKWYSTYRFWLTAAVGTSIIATLAGTQYYDISPSRSSARSTGARLANEIRENASQKAEEARATAKGELGTKPTKGDLKGGDVFAEQSTDDDEGFVKIRNPKRVEEERKKKEEEERKKKEEEEKKKKEEEEQTAKDDKADGEKDEAKGAEEDKKEEGKEEDKSEE